MTNGADIPLNMVFLNIAATTMATTIPRRYNENMTHPWYAEKNAATIKA